jgi:hypothetical protein
MKALRLSLFVILSSLAHIHAQTTLFANFDDLPEGNIGPVFASGGIVFSDLDRRVPSDPAPGQISFCADQSTILGGPYYLPGFTPPNIICFGGYGPGADNYSLGVLASLRMSVPVLCERVDLDLFSFRFSEGVAAYQLLAFNGTNLVASNSIPAIPGDNTGPIVRRQHLALGCVPPFDSARLQVLPTNAAAAVSMDNVEFTPVGAVSPPQLQRVKTTGPNITFEISGHPRREVTLETSRHQDTWKTLVTTNIPASGSLTLEIPRASVYRFYRLQEDCP